LHARLLAVAASVALLAAVVVLPAAARSHHAAATVTVTAGKPSEFKFALSVKSVTHGKVTFHVVNKGKITHNFKIAGKKTPNLASGKSANLTVTLKKGKIAYECAVPGHAAAGMKGVLVVK
jgi:uncharacterized cupredoxin-like copper-binding protein